MTNTNLKTTKKDFLFELGCEELPPKSLTKLSSSLHDHLKSSFQSLDLNFSDSEWFATPRRLAVRFLDLDLAQPDKQVEKLGPAIAAAFDQDGNPKPAANGFAKSNGVSVEDLDRKQTDKGERLAFIAEIKGQQTSELLQNLLEKAISQLPVPKAMKWGNETYQFTRPVHWILAILGNEIVDVNLFGQQASNLTYGHRFHSPDSFVIDKAADYETVLSKHMVICSFEKRQNIIRQQVEKIANDNNATAVISDSLLEEVTALVEWPVALLGKFDEMFLQVPSEALISSMAEHQKYFHLLDKNNCLLPNFITVSNIESNNPRSVIDGNEKVIRPRLADAKFFYDSDCNNTLESNTEKLKSVVFQNKLGTLYDKSQRVKLLSVAIAKQLNSDLNVDVSLICRAADLCKCDLVTNMVSEFSDLQGIMGRYYAIKDNEPKDVAAAMEEIYMPRFAGDKLPETTTGLVLALAERLDTLVGIFAIGQLPTGAKDPFALRRASLGVLRLISEKQLSLDLVMLINASIETYKELSIDQKTVQELLDFFSARTTALYQDKGISSQVIKSVQALNIAQPTDFEKRVQAVQSFDNQEASKDLAEANKRVKNILAKSNFDPERIKLDSELFEQEEEALFDMIEKVKDSITSQVQKSEYVAALEELASLKEVVNLFFDKVMINVEDESIRNNRLALINELRNLFLGIADISLLQK